MNNPINQSTDQNLTETIHRLMRTLRRRPTDQPNHSRGYRRLLWVLTKHNGATSKALSDLLDIRPASLAELLAKAESQGLIRRVRNDGDQRMINTYLAEAGQAVIRTMQSRAFDEEIYDGILTKSETTMLINLCNKLISGLEVKFQETIEPDLASAPDFAQNTLPTGSAPGETTRSNPEEV